LTVCVADKAVKITIKGLILLERKRSMRNRRRMKEVAKRNLKSEVSKAAQLGYYVQLEDISPFPSLQTQNACHLSAKLIQHPTHNS